MTTPRFFVHPSGACLDAMTARQRIRHTMGVMDLPRHVSLRAPIAPRPMIGGAA